MKTRILRAMQSLEGLATGDAFGELFFSIPVDTPDERLPRGPWSWTDDTHMALSMVETLKTCGHIDQDALARAFARRFDQDPFRGYAGGACRLLRQISEGADWREVSPALFNGGSFGNGAAMRAAPVGAFFCDDLRMAAAEARRSAVITHAHPEGQAGAIAVAVAAAIAAGERRPSGSAFIREALEYVPEGIIRERLEIAMELPPDKLDYAARVLGSGYRVSAQDTVPFCLWCAAHHLDNFEEALRSTVRGLGDRDTTCAIVGGIVALSAPGIPTLWLERREALPSI